MTPWSNDFNVVIVMSILVVSPSSQGVELKIAKMTPVHNLAEPLVISGTMKPPSGKNSFDNHFTLTLENKQICKFTYGIQTVGSNNTCSWDANHCECRYGSGEYSFTYSDNDGLWFKIEDSKKPVVANLRAPSQVSQDVSDRVTLPLFYRAYIGIAGSTSEQELSDGTKIRAAPGSQCTIRLNISKTGNEYLITVQVGNNTTRTEGTHPEVTFLSPNDNKGVVVTLSESLKAPAGGVELDSFTFTFTSLELTTKANITDLKTTPGNYVPSQTTSTFSNPKEKTKTSKSSFDIDIIIGCSVATTVIVTLFLLCYCWYERFKKRRDRALYGSREESSLNKPDETNKTSESARSESTDADIVDYEITDIRIKDPEVNNLRSNDPEIIHFGSVDSKSTDKTSSVSSQSTKNSFKEFMREIRRQLSRQPLRYLSTPDDPIISKPHATSTLDDGGHLKLYVPKSNPPNDTGLSKPELPGQNQDPMEVPSNRKVSKGSGSTKQSSTSGSQV